MTKKIAVIDLDSVCYTIFHPEKELDEQGNPRRSDDGKRFIYKEKTSVSEEDVDKVMNMILTESGADSFIGYMKGKNTTLTRLEINPDYKGNRSKEEPLLWKPTQQLLHDRWGAHWVDYMEVDDAVNITRLALPDSFICAIDGDLLGLEGTHYNWRKKEWVTVPWHEAENKFWSDMVCGQTGDNIKGIPGKGERYFQSIVTTHMELPNVVFNAYLNTLTTDRGVHEFYKNYVSLKILEKKEGFVIPEPNEFIIKQKEEESNLFT